MDPNLLDILSRPEFPITNEQLARYLKGELTVQEKHLLEKALLDNGVEADAMEGLEMIGPDKLSGYQLEISRALKEKLTPKKPLRTPRKKITLNWIIFLTGGLLALALLAWFLIYYLQR